MEERLKIKLLKGWSSNEKRKLAEKAIERIEYKNQFAFVSQIIIRSKEIYEKDFFGNIDKMITYLTKLKTEGYTSVEQHWYSYEENGFLAKKMDNETEKEMLDRFRDIIEDEVDIIEREIDEKRKKMNEIDVLKRKIKELEKGL